MTVIVTDRGFSPDDFAGQWTGPEGLPAPCPDQGLTLGPDNEPDNGPDNEPENGVGHGLDLAPDTDPDALAGRLAGRFDGLALIRVQFPSFADGRGFSIARALRRLGYRGRLRAAGHVLADQYAMARRAGFDEVEIDDALAARQPEADWRARAAWGAHDFRRRLGYRAPTGAG